MKSHQNLVIDNGEFRIHLIKGYISNIYLVEYGEALLLLDSGSISDIKTIEEYCQKICGRPLSDIKLSVVSHMHPDHAGGGAVLREKHGIPVAAFSSVDEWYKGLTGLIQHALDCKMEQFVGKSLGNKRQRVYFKRSLRPDYPLHEGGALPFFNDWNILHIPGHTLHDIAVFHPVKKIVHTGDAIIKVKDQYRLPIPVYFKNTMKRSCKKLAELAPQVILPGHGKALFPADPVCLFNHLAGLVDKPRSSISKKAHLVSIFTPAVWKGAIRKVFSLKNRRTGSSRP